jgi:hypothetical protein
MVSFLLFSEFNDLFTKQYFGFFSHWQKLCQLNKNSPELLKHTFSIIFRRTMKHRPYSIIIICSENTQQKPAADFILLFMCIYPTYLYRWCVIYYFKYKNKFKQKRNEKQKKNCKIDFEMERK